MDRQKFMIPPTTVEFVPWLYAGNFNRELEDWCVSREITTHGDGASVVFVGDENSPLAAHCREKDIPLPCFVAITGT